jgi:hypothetical protein
VSTRVVGGATSAPMMMSLKELRGAVGGNAVLPLAGGLRVNIQANSLGVQEGMRS